MRSIIQIIILLVCIGRVVAQDSNLYQTWYLYQLETDLEGVVWDIEEESAEILPFITINNDLTFDGLGACNGFSGFYIYNSTLNSIYPNNVLFTLGGCDTPEEISFENIYFPYVDADTEHTITLIDHSDYMELRLETFPGFIHIYRNVSLSNTEYEKPNFKLYPNPAAEKLHILYDGPRIEKTTVYDIKGNKFDMDIDINGFINISNLESGLYFLEIESSIGIDRKKFIKI